MTGKLNWLAMVVLVATLGCGKSEYEAAMNSRLKDIAFESNFIEGLAEEPTEIIKGVADLRLPSYIAEDATTLTSTSKNKIGEPINVRRIQPPGIKIPGFRYSYEQFEEVSGRNDLQPFYVYFGSRPGSEPLKKITSAISRKGPWTTEDLITPDRGQLKFQKLTMKGSQDFELDPRGGEIKKKPGLLEIYVHSTKEHHIIIGFRATDEVAKKVEIFDVVPYSLGTLTVASSEEDDEDDS